MGTESRLPPGSCALGVLHEARTRHSLGERSVLSVPSWRDLSETHLGFDIEELSETPEAGEKGARALHTCRMVQKHSGCSSPPS